MNKKWLIGIVVVIVIVLVWWMMAAEKAVAPTDTMANAGVTATIYDEQLDGLDEADMQAEFNGVDSDLNKL